MEYIKRLNQISSNLRNCEIVTKYSNDEENQVDTFAHALLDIDESAKKIINMISNLSSKEASAEIVDDLILEIGEELRHILYHVYDTKVYDYLKPE